MWSVVCGLAECSIELKKSSGRGKIAIAAAESNCLYKSKFSLKAAEKSTKTGPCTNRPITSSIYKVITWSYSIALHYMSKHPDYPTKFIISPEEVKLVLAKNSKL